MEKILYTRWKVSVHDFPNQQTFARKHSIINLLRSCLSKPLQHSGIIPFYSQLLKNSSKLHKTHPTNIPQPTHSNTNLLPSKATRSFTSSCIYSKPPTSASKLINSGFGCSMLLKISNTRCNLYW